MSDDALAKRRAEDAELERQRRSKLQYLALDMVAEHHGHADWQRFRARSPFEFFRAKVEICEGPPGLRLDVYQDLSAGFGDMIFRFDWFTGEWRRYGLTVSVCELQRLADCDDGRAVDFFLGHVMHGAARQIERDSGAVARIRIRRNRAAYEEAIKSRSGCDV